MSNLAYGFVDYAHTVEEAITTIGEQAVYDAVVESARFHSTEIQKIYGLLASQGIDHQELVKIAVDAELQPITDQTQPDPIKVLGQYTQGYPMRRSGIAFGFDRMSRHTMSVGDANRQTLTMLKADARFLKRHMLAALFTDAQYNFLDEKHGTLVVKPLANGDSVVYEKIDGTRATANHYGAQANAIDDGADNPFPGIYTTLMSYESNRGREVVTYVADDLVESIEGLAGFVAVTDPKIIQPITSHVLAPGIPDPGPGEEIIGRVDRHWICKWAAVPSGYMVSVVIGGEPVLRQRNMPIPDLQGFFAERNGGDGNLSQLNLIRYCGFGVRNRLGAYVHRVGNGSYAPPSAYATVPLAA